MEKAEILKKANLGVVHQRITEKTADMHIKGKDKKSAAYNNKWSDFVSNNFRGEKYAKKNAKFEAHNMKLQKAIKHKKAKKE